jgi:hypothetical protein
MVPRAAIPLAVLYALPAAADIVYQTNPPYLGPSGPPGFDLSDDQSVALRFTPDRDYTLDTIRMWIMSNDFNQVSYAPVRVELRPSQNGGRRPGTAVIELMTFTVSAFGWNPVLESVSSRNHPLLRANVPYWVILHCDLHKNNPSWNWSDNSIGIIALSHGGQVNFTEGGEGAVTGTTIEGTPACYANCDRSTAAPILNVNDFVCFLGNFAVGDEYANCDSSEGTPTLTANDFLCFLNVYTGGCS